MPGLAAAAAAIGIAAASSQRFQAPLTVLQFGDLRYNIREVDESPGLGVSAAACAGSGDDFVMVVYRVTNGADHDLSAAAAPRLALIDPLGQTHARDQRLSGLVESQDAPLLSFHGGRLPAGQSVVLADVFVVRRDAIRQGAWTVKPAILGGQAYRLPQVKSVAAPDCPGAAPSGGLETDQAG